MCYLIAKDKNGPWLLCTENCTRQGTGRTEAWSEQNRCAQGHSAGDYQPPKRLRGVCAVSFCGRRKRVCTRRSEPVQVTDKQKEAVAQG